MDAKEYNNALMSFHGFACLCETKRSFTSSTSSELRSTGIMVKEFPCIKLPKSNLLATVNMMKSSAYLVTHFVTLRKTPSVFWHGRDTCQQKQHNTDHNRCYLKASGTLSTFISHVDIL